MNKLALLLLCACSVKPGYSDPGRFSMTNFQFHATRTTLAGTVLDDPNNQVSDSAIDRTVDATLQCLDATAALTGQERQVAWCFGRALYKPVYGLRILVVTDWYISACSGKELFHCAAPDASCEAKGLKPTSACPCACRAAIQDDDFIATAPNLELLPWRIVELLTGCEQITYVPRLSACGSPNLVSL